MELDYLFCVKRPDKYESINDGNRAFVKIGGTIYETHSAVELMIRLLLKENKQMKKGKDNGRTRFDA